MAAWQMGRTTSWSGRAVVAAGLLALLLVAGVPAALFVGVIMMLLGHVVGGLALFGASVLAAVGAVVLAGLSGVRHLRKLVSRQGFLANRQGFRVVQLPRDEYHYD